MEESRMKGALATLDQAVANPSISEDQFKKIMESIDEASWRHSSAAQMMKRIAAHAKCLAEMSDDLCRWWQKSEANIRQTPDSVKPVLTEIRNKVWGEMLSQWCEALGNGYVIDLDAELPEEIAF